MVFCFITSATIMQVFKFGGASVNNSDGVRNVLSILQSQAKQETLVVVSAMGKTTNKLEALVKAYVLKESDVFSILEEVKRFHFDIASNLFPDSNHSIFNDLNNVMVELQWAIEEEPSYTYDFHYDQIVSQGEILSTKIVSAFLKESKLHNYWVDARGLLQTDNTYREANVDYSLSQERINEELLPLLQKHKLVLTQGFIGGTSENFSSTLGREGSDYSAALFGYFTNAKQVIIWKDVAGVLNADPKYFRNTKKIDELSYHDAIELTYFGASVIHHKTIKPLQNKGIPLLVKSFLDPNAPGTLIRDGETGLKLASYIFKTDQILLSIQAKDFGFIAEDHLSKIFTLFSKHKVRVNMMQNSAISFSVCVDDDKQKMENLLNELQNQFQVLYNSNVQLMTIRNYNQKIIEQLSENKIILLEQRSRHTCQLVMKGDISE